MIRSLIARLFCLAALVAVATGCNKEEDTTAIITIVDEDGHPVEGAYVKLFPNLAYPLGDPSRLMREELTDGKGEAKFDYTDQFKQGQAGFAVLDIVSYHDSSTGEGIIKILEEEENAETVVLEYAY